MMSIASNPYVPMDVPPWLWLMKSPSLPCLEEFSLHRLFGALSLHLQELWGSPLAKWNTLPRANPQSPSPTVAQPPHPTWKKTRTQRGLLGALPFHFQLHLQLTVGGLVGAAHLAQVRNLFRPGQVEIVCLKHV